jgi:hypothetical protein
MTNKETEGDKMSCSISDDGEVGYIFDETAEKLFARINFYETGHTLSNKEKKEVLEKTINNIFETIVNEEEERKNQSWNNRCEAFKEAHQYEPKQKSHATWLMTSILGVTEEEADRRWEIAEDLMNHSDFKDKKEVIMNRVYLNKSHLKNK